MDLQPGQVVADRYVVESTLGAGGVAVVYRVRHLQLDTVHALKRMSNQTPMVRQRLLQEGRAQGALRHPNLVAVTDVVDLDGWPALVLDYVAGPPLHELLAQRPLTLEQADALARGILDGVAFAHEHHFVHRDIKPANVLCAIADGALVPKVADFGLVKCLHPDQADVVGFTRTGAALGTPAYMAPEQIRSARDIDARADVWALGVLLYELVCGARPFQGPDPFAVQQAATTGDRLPVRERAPDCPDRIVASIDAALAVDPADRPADAAALRALWVAESQAPSPDWSALDLDDWTHDPAPPRTGSGSETLDAFASDPGAGLAWTHEFDATTPAADLPVIAPEGQAPVPRSPSDRQSPVAGALGLAGVGVLSGLAAGALVLFALSDAPEPGVAEMRTEPASSAAPESPVQRFSERGLSGEVPADWAVEPVYKDKPTYRILRMEFKDGRGNSAWVHDFRPRSKLNLDSLAERWVEVFYAGLEKDGMTLLESERVPFDPGPFLGDADAAGLRYRAVRQEQGEPTAFSIEITAAEPPEHEVYVIARYADADRERFEAQLAALRASLEVSPDTGPADASNEPATPVVKE